MYGTSSRIAGPEKMSLCFCSKRSKQMEKGFPVVVFARKAGPGILEQAKSQFFCNVEGF